jgi:hypothetical protein
MIRLSSVQFPTHALSFYFGFLLQVNIFEVILFDDILHLTVILVIVNNKIAVLVSCHSDILNNDKSLSVVFRLSFFFFFLNMTKK